MKLVKFTCYDPPNGWSKNLWINVDKIIAVFKVPRNGRVGSVTVCTRIDLGNDYYFDVEETPEEIASWSE